MMKLIKELTLIIKETNGPRREEDRILIAAMREAGRVRKEKNKKLSCIIKCAIW